MTDWTERAGFGSPIAEKTFAKRRRLGVELFATLALVISLIVAATAVSIGVARAQAGYTARHAGGALGFSLGVSRRDDGRQDSLELCGCIGATRRPGSAVRVRL